MKGEPNVPEHLSRDAMFLKKIKELTDSKMKNTFWIAGETYAPYAVRDNDSYIATIDYTEPTATWIEIIEVNGKTREDAEMLRDVILEHLQHGNY
jgi:hypothetical protein